jgi:hypothetical protein
MDTIVVENIFAKYIKWKTISKRVLALLNAIVMNTSVCIRRIAEDRAEEVAFNRLLGNEDLRKVHIMKALYEKTAKRVNGKHILAIQDTSELNYQSMEKRVSGLGTVGNGIDKGFFIHPMIAVNESDNALLGLAAIKIINRLEPKAANYKSIPIEKKESYKWLSCSLRAKITLKEADMITHISDRESDIYEFLYRVPDKKNHVLIRSAQNRNIENSEKKLFEYVGEQKVKGTYTVKVSGIPNKRTAHEAKLEVRFTKVVLSKPLHCSDKRAPEQITVNAIELKESKTTVHDGEEPVYWLLLTTHKVATLEDAKRIAGWYCQRWHIEQVFRTLKSQGLMIERSQVETVDAKIKLTLLAVEAAMQIMQLTLARKENNTRPAYDVFNDEEIECLTDLQKKLEGKTEKQKNHYKVGSLLWASWCIARLGGWKGYKSESPAGPITMSRGLYKFKSIFEGWSLYKMCID